MKLERLQVLQQKGIEGEITSGELMEVVSEFFLSQSRHANEIKAALKQISEKQAKLESDIDYIKRNCVSSIFQMIEEDPSDFNPELEEEEEDTEEEDLPESE